MSESFPGQPESADDATAPGGGPGAPPREVGVRARRRSWGEPGVRLWWLSALVVAGIGAFVAGTNLVQEWADQKLIREGVPVEAKIVSADGKRHGGYVVRVGESAELEFTYSLPGQETAQRVVTMVKAEKHPLETGKTFTIRVDPNNPRRWTSREEVNWSNALFVPLAVVGFALPLLGVALWARGRVLRVWRAGQGMRAVVVETKQAAGAPLSRVVRYTLEDSADARVFSVVMPTKFGLLAPGDVFWVVAEPQHPGRAVAAAAYA